MIRKKLKRSYRISKYVLYKETLIDYKEQFWSFIGAFLGIGCIAYLQTTILGTENLIFLIGSFGASAVLVYGAIESPLAQPRNLLGGHIISALIGVLITKILPDIIYLQAPLAVATSIIAMQITKTMHPPGGATALIAVSGGENIKALGFNYILFPVTSGALILLIFALIFNNITTHRTYPKQGFKRKKQYLRSNSKYLR